MTPLKKRTPFLLQVASIPRLKGRWRRANRGAAWGNLLLSSTRTSDHLLTQQTPFCTTAIDLCQVNFHNLWSDALNEVATVITTSQVVVVVLLPTCLNMESWCCPPPPLPPWVETSLLLDVPSCQNNFNKMVSYYIRNIW